jgi:hypothetical protein
MNVAVLATSPSPHPRRPLRLVSFPRALPLVTRSADPAEVPCLIASTTSAVQEVIDFGRRPHAADVADRLLA